MCNSVIEIDIWSSFGNFKKSFSNKGGLLTYLIPPKTAIIGMIGSVLGIEYNQKDEMGFAIEKLFDVKISIQPLFNLRTIRVKYNSQENTKTGKYSILNIDYDLLVNPKYKLFLSFPDNLKNYEKEFISRIKSKKTVYNLYMGKNEFPLSYKYINTHDKHDVKYTNDSNLKNLHVIGFLKRSLIKNLCVEKKDSSKDFFDYNINDSKPFFEYMINDYPIKRNNFTNFTYDFISFFPKDNQESYFTNIVLKGNNTINLTKIGEYWVCLI